MDDLRREIAALVKSEVDSQETHADKIIRTLFSHAEPINTDDETIFMTAWRRAQCHLPPGKKDDLGDRLVWVALLEKLPSHAQLHIVSGDKDYGSDGFTEAIRPYLKWEWEKKKKGVVRLWARISQFLAAHFPDAESALEMERGILALRLRESGNFWTTHTTIADLTKLDGFNAEHLRYIAEALVENGQVRLILGDSDVKTFYRGIADKFRGRLDTDLQAKVDSLLSDEA